MSLSVIIPSAGVGSRLGLGIPKALLPLGGKTLLEWQIQLLSEFELEVIVVVGYRADLVEQLVLRNRMNVQLVTNLEYEGRGTASSVRIAARECSGDVIILDGDLLVHPKSFRSFVSSQERLLIGWSRTRSTQPVFVHTIGTMVHNFSRSKIAEKEWTGPLRCKCTDAANFGDKHVFENLIDRLPAEGVEVDCVEIDDPEDVPVALTWLSTHGFLGSENEL